MPLSTPNFSCACLHASQSGGRSRLEAVRGMPHVPIAPQPPGPRGGWAAVGFVSPASFNRGLWARLLRVFGFLTSDFGVGKGQDLGCLTVSDLGLILPESACRWPQVFDTRAIRLRPMTLFNPVFNCLTPIVIKRSKTQADEGLSRLSRRSWLCRSASAPSQQACEPV